jgi:uncharacterized protein DUF2726
MPHSHRAEIGTLIPWIAFIAFGLLLAAHAALAKSKHRKARGLDLPWPLERRRSLLTDPEQILYRRLIQALPDHVVFAQVQLLQMVRFKRHSPPYAVLNRMSRLSLDFVVLTPNIPALSQRSSSTTLVTSIMTVSQPMHANLTR